MKCTFVASSTYSYPSISSNSLPGSISSKDSLLLLEAAPLLPPPGNPALPWSSLQNPWGTCQPVMAPVSHLYRSKHFSRGCQEVKALSTNALRATEGSGSNVRRSPSVQLMPLVKAVLPSAPSSPPANVFYHPQDGCRLVHASSTLPSRASFTRESRSHFGGLRHTAGLRQKAGNNVGTQAENIHVPLEGLSFSPRFFPRIYPTPKEEGKHNAH